MSCRNAKDLLKAIFDNCSVGSTSFMQSTMWLILKIHNTLSLSSFAKVSLSTLRPGLARIQTVQLVAVPLRSSQASAQGAENNRERFLQPACEREREREREGPGSGAGSKSSEIGVHFGDPALNLRWIRHL